METRQANGIRVNTSIRVYYKETISRASVGKPDDVWRVFFNIV